MSSIRATPTAGARAAHTLDQPHALDQSQNADQSESADRSGAADQPEGPSRSRAGAAEVIGTFFLVYAGTATAAAAHLGETIAGSPADSLAIALAFGFVLAAMVAGLGQVSGAHLNGAVTLGLAVTGRFPWRFVPTYLLCQLFGAVLAPARPGRRSVSGLGPWRSSGPPSPLPASGSCGPWWSRR